MENKNTNGKFKELNKQSKDYTKKYAKEDVGFTVVNKTIRYISPIMDKINEIASEKNLSDTQAVNYFLCNKISANELISKEQLEVLVSLIFEKFDKTYVGFNSLLSNLLDSLNTIEDYYDFFMGHGFEATPSRCLSTIIYSNIECRFSFVKLLQSKIENELGITLSVNYPTYNLNSNLEEENTMKVTTDFIKENPNQIVNVINPSKDLLLTAFEQDITLIKHFEYLDLDTQLYFINENVDNIKYINNPHETVQLMAINLDINLIKYIKNPTSTVQLLVLQKDRTLIKYIEKPDKQVKTILNIK